MSVVASSAPLRVYLPTLSTPAAAPRLTDGKYSPFRALTSLLVSLISWSAIFNSWLLLSAESINATRFASENNSRQFTSAVLVESPDGSYWSGVDWLADLSWTCGAHAENAMATA